MLAWNSDYHYLYVDIAGHGLLPVEAERQGKVVITTELGGGGVVTAAVHRLAERGLANVLRHAGILEGEVEVTFRGETTIARAGETINVPANAPHNFGNLSDQPARL